METMESANGPTAQGRTHTQFAGDVTRASGRCNGATRPRLRRVALQTLTDKKQQRKIAAVAASIREWRGRDDDARPPTLVPCLRRRHFARWRAPAGARRARTCGAQCQGPTRTRSSSGGPQWQRMAPGKGAKGLEAPSALRRTAPETFRRPAGAADAQRAREQGAQCHRPTRTRRSAGGLQWRRLAQGDPAVGPTARSYTLAPRSRNNARASGRCGHARSPRVRSAAPGTHTNEKQRRGPTANPAGIGGGRRGAHGARLRACAVHRRHCESQRALQARSEPALSAQSTTDPHVREAAQGACSGSGWPRGRQLKGRRRTATRLRPALETFRDLAVATVARPSSARGSQCLGPTRTRSSGRGTQGRRLASEEAAIEPSAHGRTHTPCARDITRASGRCNRAGHPR